MLHMIAQQQQRWGRSTQAGKGALGCGVVGDSHRLALKEGLSVLVDLELGDDALGGVQANIHCRAVHLRAHSAIYLSPTPAL